MAHGQPMAPYNTTQFLLEDKVAQNQEPDVDALLESLERERGSSAFRERAMSGSAASGSGDVGTSGSLAGDSSSYTDSDFEREFRTEYDMATAERLESLSKQELIRDYLALEHELEATREQLRKTQAKIPAAANPPTDLEQQQIADSQMGASLLNSVRRIHSSE